MDDFKPAARLSIIMGILVENPGQLFSLGDFAERFSVAKSTLSEDISRLKYICKSQYLGEIETVTGAAGGIKYVPLLAKKDENQILKKIADKIKDPARILPGGFLYMTDIIFSSKISWQIAKIFATRFKNIKPDYVITVETKGIPLAMMTARAFSVPAITIRRNHKVTEGAVLSNYYFSGSSKKIQTMSLARRALKPGAKVLVIDDFMKAGGTAKGILDLMEEFKVEVVGTGVMIATATPEKKLIDEYLTLFTLTRVDEKEGVIEINY